MEQFIITLDNAYGPEAVYAPGQMVTGRVMVNTLEEIKTSCLQLTFCGKAVTDWREGSGRHERHYYDEEIYFEFKESLLGNDNFDATISSGHFSYPFSFQLPSPLPSSFVGLHGSVEYNLDAVIKRSLFMKDYKTHLSVKVFCPVDLNLEPEASKSMEWTKSKQFCCFCCASRPLEICARMEKVGYCPGETITIEGEINNHSSKRIDFITAQLFQNTTFFASTMLSGMYSTKEQKSLIKVSLNVAVEPYKTDCQYRMTIQIPPQPVFNLAGCKLITIDYEVEIECHVSGIALNLRLPCPILIGSIPVTQIISQ